MQQGASDDFQTPPIALNPLLPYLKKEWIIWECAAGMGNLSTALREKGYQVETSDITDTPPRDFLNYEPPSWDCIVTNPPFSIKQEFLQRCYSLQKPFALLLPLTTFETAKRQALFQRHGVQIILFDKRINFETPSGKGSGSWFATAWFTNLLNLPHTLNYATLNPPTTQKTLNL